MTITEVIEHLEIIRRMHGDLQVVTLESGMSQDWWGTPEITAGKVIDHDGSIIHACAVMVSA